MNRFKNILEVGSSLVSVAEAKEFLRVTDNAEDNYISVCIDSAISYAENRLGFCVESRINEITISGYTPGQPFTLAPDTCPQEVTIDSVEDPAGDPIEYTYSKGIISLASGDTAIVKYTVTPNIEGVKHVKQAILLLVGKYYEQRGDDTRSNTEGGWETVDRLLSLVSNIWL